MRPFLGFVFVLGLCAPMAGADGISSDVLLKAKERDDLWVNYSRDYRGWRYAPMDQINRETVKRLVPKWAHQSGVLGGAYETTAICDGDRLYITTPNNHLFCLDVRTGKTLWHFEHLLPPDIKLCCGPVNRGVAVYEDKVVMGTLDARLMCFDAKTGLQLWDRQVADYRDSYSITSAPLIVNGLAIIGPGGAEYGVRGFLDAYDVLTGERVWRFWGTAGPGDPNQKTWKDASWEHGGGTAWLPGSYDPELNLLYWGMGNPSPDWNSAIREGDNLYTECIVALRPETGELVWYFQNTPHDIFDWAGVQTPILVDETVDGKPVKALIQANRNGYLYALDRTDGSFLYAKPFTETNWEIMGEDGIPRVDPKIFTLENNHICPGVFGGVNWPASAYSPDTHMIYIPEMKRCTLYTQLDVVYRRGLPYYGGTIMFDDQNPLSPVPAEGHIKAFDVRTGEEKWAFDVGGPNWAGILATAGGLVFGGAPDGYLRAFNDETGEVLWKFQTGSGLYAPPISFMLDGKQVVGIASGWGQPAKIVGLNNESQGSSYYLFELVGE